MIGHRPRQPTGPGVGTTDRMVAPLRGRTNGPRSPVVVERRQRTLLESAFERVDVSGTVWWNAPPAFVYTCRTGARPSWSP